MKNENKQPEMKKEVQAQQFTFKDKDRVYLWASSIQQNVYHKWGPNKEPIMLTPTETGVDEVNIDDWVIKVSDKQVMACGKEAFEANYILKTIDVKYLKSKEVESDKSIYDYWMEKYPNGSNIHSQFKIFKTGFRGGKKSTESKILHFINSLEVGLNPKGSFEVKSIKVNNKKIDVPVKHGELLNGILSSEFTIPLSGCEIYNVEIIVKKVYSLKTDNIMRQGNSYFINNFVVQFQLNNVKLEFFEVGTLRKFETNTSNPGLISKEYTGLLYPKQGYMAILRKN